MSPTIDHVVAFKWSLTLYCPIFISCSLDLSKVYVFKQPLLRFITPVLKNKLKE